MDWSFLHNRYHVFCCANNYLHIAQYYVVTQLEFIIIVIYMVSFVFFPQITFILFSHRETLEATSNQDSLQWLHADVREEEEWVRVAWMNEQPNE